MTRNMTEGAHVRLTPPRPGTHADTVRAQILADALRAAIGKYQDTTAAVGDGYKMFAPQLKEQPVFHFTNWTAAVKAALTFDAARPTSLLYVKGKTGEFKLIGAMYTAPARMGAADHRPHAGETLDVGYALMQIADANDHMVDAGENLRLGAGAAE